VQMALNVGKRVCRKHTQTKGYPHGITQQGMQRAEQGLQCAAK